ncbi:hypothetical protein EGM88_14540 [Aureibaculum marinum]|uniref:YcxB-like C-terminal domain-containing protein n=1 Tax=Aureibaculum marinum TaxID=2487930 RepID=A0A3N4N8H7_9FLAO|nr:YcxB family protein [Aureibaculum marinum]RPD91655.1 hypothetical protein EGM88_14540 [Aureibaculum marinum]
MHLRYKLNSNDFLQQVLYYNSNNKTSKKQRLKVWLFVTLIIFSIALIIYFYKDQIEIGHYLGAIPILILGIFLFPYFYRNVLKKRFFKLVEENYKNNFGKEFHLFFQEKELEINDTTGTSKIDYSSLEKIIEIGTHFFFVINTGVYLIIPKSELDNVNIIRKKIKDIAVENQILFSSELDWKWK